MDNVKIDKLIRAKRKTFSIEITHDSKLIVRTPENVSIEQIKEVVDKKKKWIRSKKEFSKKKYSKLTPKEIINGEGFLYLGNLYKLHIIDIEDVPLVFDNKFYLSKNMVNQAEQVFIDWYKKQARIKIKERIEWFSKLTGMKYNKINITNAKKRWGSCSSKRNLNFSWRLIMAPIRVIDYVVAHELVHLEEKNHSKKFWDKVKVMMPDYEKQRRWLKENEYLLRFEL